MCTHQPSCPPPYAPDHAAARAIVNHFEQGWSLLCNGVVTFDDTGELLPNNHAVTPHQPAIGQTPAPRRAPTPSAASAAPVARARNRQRTPPGTTAQRRMAPALSK